MPQRGDCFAGSGGGRLALGTISGCGAVRQCRGALTTTGYGSSTAAAAGCGAATAALIGAVARNTR
jgi:hypothetical protein